MIDHGDRLREAFETHEHLAPDPAKVYARVQELARTYQRRRWGAQAAGGAVLGAGLIAGAINLPAFLPGGQPGNVAVVAPAAAPATPAPSASPQDDLEAAYNAYFSAGYDYDDAVKLAEIWKSTDEVGAIKAEAGRRLLAGETLPVQPTPGDDTATDDGGDPAASARLDAYFGAGYDYGDAVRLAELWQKADPYDAKIEGGKRILAGDEMPFRP